MESVKALGRDPITRIAAAVICVICVPYLVPFFDPDGLYVYGDMYAIVPALAIAVFALQYDLQRIEDNTDRRFWRLWSLGCALWLLVRVLFIVIPWDWWNTRTELVTDLLYVLCYLSIIFALGIEPDRRSERDRPHKLMSLENVGIAVLLFGLWVYFAVIPSVLNVAAYDSWLPSLLLYVALDFYVFFRCIYLWRTSQSRLWRTVFAWLAITAALWVATDGTEALDYARLIPEILPGSLLDLFWFIPMLTLVIAARVHRLGWVAKKPLMDDEVLIGASSKRAFLGGALVVGALIMPVVHFTCYSLGLLDPSTQAVRGLWVLAVLLGLLAMELVNQQVIQRNNRELDESRKSAEDKRRLLVTAVEQAGESIIVTDRNGVIEYVNPAFERTLGYSSAEAVGRNTSTLKSGLHDEQFYRDMWSTISAGKIWQGRLVDRRKDGSLCEQTVSIAPVVNSDGEIVRYVAVERDITNQVQLERQLGESQKMEALGTLAGGIAHDFNNILHAITGYSELLRDQLPEATNQRNNVEMVLKSAARAKGIIKQILSFARKPKEEREPTHIPKLIDETVSLLRASLPSTIEISANIAADAGVVVADPHQIQQVLLNLGSNASHAIGDGPGTLEIEVAHFKLDSSDKVVLDGLRAGSYVGITVRDSGSGMEADTLDRIYEPFFTTKEVGTGTGLGLSVAHGIVHGHGGAIEVTSELGRGTTFRLYFPRFADNATPNVSPNNPGESMHAGGHVLVVDDEQPIQDLMRGQLERLGYSVTIAQDGEAGLSEFQSRPDAFDAIITDQTMPGRTGLQFVREVRRVRSDLPVILTTGFSSAVTPGPTKEVGIGAVLMKPFTASQLAATLKDVLGVAGKSELPPPA